MPYLCWILGRTFLGLSQLGLGDLQVLLVDFIVRRQIQRLLVDFYGLFVKILARERESKEKLRFMDVTKFKKKKSYPIRL